MFRLRRLRRQSRSPIALSIALICALGQGVAIGHNLLVEHGRCPEHGELIHRAHHAEHAALPIETGLTAIGATDAEEDDAHDHCDATSERRQARISAPAPSITLLLVAPVEPAVARDQVPARCAIYASAPKTSPPV